MSEHVLICGVNWLGDAIMSMPAIQLFREAHAATRITMAVKRPWCELWRMHPAVDAVMEFPARTSGMRAAARAMAAARFDRTVILPNSFRSALVPFLARVPRRRGASGQWRDMLLTQSVTMPRIEGAPRHQAWEYARLLAVDGGLDTLPQPQLTIERQRVHAFLPSARADARWVGVLPGAARGPSKRWPPNRFAMVARALVERHGVQVMVLGSAAESTLCAQVADSVGAKAVNLGGRTSLPELAALLGVCSLVLSNDSGGMHLASAVGAPVVAVFGLTDPTVTGPIGARHRVISAGVAGASRNIPRESSAAEQALGSISVEQVQAAAESMLEEGAF